MTDAELIEFGGWLLASWGFGYTLGLFVWSFKRFMEKI